MVVVVVVVGRSYGWTYGRRYVMYVCTYVRMYEEREREGNEGHGSDSL